MGSVWFRYPRVTLRFPGYSGIYPSGTSRIPPIKIDQFSIQEQKEGRPPLLFCFKENFPHASSTILGHIPFLPGIPLRGNRMPSHPSKDWAHLVWIQSSLWRSCVCNDFAQQAPFQFIAALISNKSE